ncbi:MAG TPA: nucleotide exchange factor GrpE [Patescibacteria group bacterium]|nr:nucleotide exchange factor GrpE [Patescibacteria group bacterium]
MKDEKKQKQDEIEESEEAIEIEDEQDEENDEIAVLQEQVSEFEAKYKRAIADYQNLQKRVQDEKSEWIRASNRDLLLRLLPVLDTLMMAQHHLQDKGLEVSINHFLDTIKAEGVTKIKTVGEVFDPMIMEAITVAEGEEGKVLEELRAGYMLYDKVLRAAQVQVGKES